MSLWSKHAVFEKNSIILVIGILIVMVAPAVKRRRAEITD